MNLHGIAWRPRGPLAGALLGLLAVLASGLLAGQGAPPAYGICVACHGRDLLAGLGLSALTGPSAVVGSSAVGGSLVLTTLGILLGAALAASAHGERRRKHSRSPVRSLFLGMVTMSASLLALGCTTRLALRAAYGDPLALWSLGGAALGILGTTGLMIWHARRAEVQL